MINFLLSCLSWVTRGILTNIYTILELLVKYPAQAFITLTSILVIYRIFLWLGFNQKRSIKLSAPYQNNEYYLQKLQHGDEEPHHFYYLQVGPLSRPMFCICCNEAITGFTRHALCCDVCGYCVHETCVDKAVSNCKSVSMFQSRDEVLKFLSYMHGDDKGFIRSNTPTPSVKQPKAIAHTRTTGLGNDDEKTSLISGLKSNTVKPNVVAIEGATAHNDDIDVDVAVPIRRRVTRSMARHHTPDDEEEQIYRDESSSSKTQSQPLAKTRTKSVTRKNAATSPVRKSSRTRRSDKVKDVLPSPTSSNDASLTFPPASPSDFPLWHKWSQGNHSTIGDVCIICSQATGSLFSMSGLHCLWCRIHIHEECLSQLNADVQSPRLHCNMGPLGKLIVPPYSLFPHAPHSISTARLTMQVRYTHSAIAERKRNGSQADVDDFERLFDVEIPSWCSPLLVFVNRKSGGNRGIELMHDFLELLNPIQVWDLSEHPPELALSVFANVPRLRVLVCGGDGTVAWVLAAVDKLVSKPPIAVMPLGTGNDLAQVLGWGGRCPDNTLSYVLHTVMKAGLAVLDRWDVQVTDLDEVEDDKEEPVAPAKERPFNSMYKAIKSLKEVFPIFAPRPRGYGAKKGILNNYMGFGVDAVIAHQFHMLRSRYPHLFRSQTMNKLWYARIGVGQYLNPFMRGGLSKRQVRVLVDGVEVDTSECQGVCLLNIKSFGGGINFWGAGSGPEANGGFSEPAMDDGMLEVIGFSNSVHMALIQIGRALPYRLGQGRHVTVFTDGELPCQIDGEQWGVKRKCRIDVTLRTQSLMLTPTVQSNNYYANVNVSVTKALHDVLHWAIETDVISEQQSSQIITEFTKKYNKIVPFSDFYNPLPLEEE